MNTYRRHTFLIVLIMVLLLFCSCQSGNPAISNPPVSTLPKVPATPTPTSNNIPVETKKAIDVTVSKFYNAVDNQSSAEYIKIINGRFDLIRTFMSGNGTRGKDFSIDIEASKVTKDLTFALIEHEYPVSLKAEFQTRIKDPSEIKYYVIESELEWNSMERLSIVSYCNKITGYQKKFGEETRIYVFKGGDFCLAQFAGSGYQYSQWVFFKKQDNYYIKTMLLIY